MGTRRHVATALLAAIVLGSLSSGAAPAGALSAVFDPTLAATAEPILVRADGDAIPIDASGIGGEMLDRLPTDPRTAAERAIESDIAAAINLERTTRGLAALQLSDNLSAIEHRFVEQLVSDTDDYPTCPRVGTSESCDAAPPSFDQSQFVNPFNGDLGTFTHASGGSLPEADDIRPGAFVNTMMQSDAARAAVLTTQATHVGVGVKCGADGATYIVWDSGAFDPSVMYAEPATWQGEYVAPANNSDFGARCPQPAPTFATASDASGTLSVVLTGLVDVEPCHSTIGGPLLAGATMARAQLSRDGVVIATQTWIPYSPSGYEPYTFTGLVPGTYTVTVDGFDDCEATLSRTAEQVVSVAVPAFGARFVASNPIREVDTRSSHGGDRVDGGRVTRFVLADVPAAATAVTGNLTIVGQAAAGYATLFSCDATSPPRTSTVNYVAGQTTPNQFTIAVVESAICLVSSQTVDVVIDLQGVWIADVAGAELIPASERLWDTRTQGGVVDHVLALQLPGASSMPGLRGVSLNVTAEHAAAAGFVTVWPCVSARPVVSSLNPSSATAANLVTVVVPADDPRVCLYASQRVDLVVDLVGWWATGTGDRHLLTKVPIRVLDSRFADWPLRPGVSQQVIPARPGIAVLNITAVGGKAPGWIAIYSCGAGYGGTSTVNFVIGDGVSNAALVDSASAVCAVSSTTVQIVVDDTGSIR